MPDEGGDLLLVPAEEKDVAHHADVEDAGGWVSGAGGEEEQKSIVEHTTEIIQKIFTACLSDRSSPRNARPEGKKVGVYIFANLVLKLLFTVSFPSKRTR